jgi:hypothetical protein
MAAPRFDREELANAASHALGCALALAAAPLLVEAAAARAGGLGAAAVSAFCTSMVLMYAASTACHACPPGQLKRVLQAVDHAAIFVFIAGSATPYTLVPTTGTVGAATGALIWLLALAGACLKLRGRLPTDSAVTRARRPPSSGANAYNDELAPAGERVPTSSVRLCDANDLRERVQPSPSCSLALRRSFEHVKDRSRNVSIFDGCPAGAIRAGQGISAHT